MNKKLYTKIKTEQGIVRIPQDDIELQKVVSLIYSMDIEIDQLKEKLEKAIKTLEVVCAQYKCDCDDGVFESQELSRQTLKEIRGENE